MSAEKPCTFRTTLWEKHYSDPYPPVRQLSQEVLTELSQGHQRCYRTGTVTQEMRCWATSISTLQNSWCDYRNPEKKYLNHWVTRASHSSPSLPAVPIRKHSLSAPHTAGLSPSAPSSHLIFRHRCVSTMTDWSLISPLLSMLPISINKNIPWSQEPREPGNPFSLWTLFPKGWEPKKLDSIVAWVSRRVWRRSGRWEATTWQVSMKGQDIRRWFSGFPSSQRNSSLASQYEFRVDHWLRRS